MGPTGERGPLPEQVLARRYELLLLAYPPGYRRRRSAEILGTVLDCARPGQRRPGLADAADLVRGGLRARFDRHRVPGLAAGLVVAGPLALALAAGLSAFLWLVCEPVPHPLDYGQAWQHPTFGPFFTLGPISYAAWLLAAAGRVLLPPLSAPLPGGRRAIPLDRALTWLALLATLALLPASALTGYARPALWSAGALTLLGVVALAGTGRPAPPAERLGVLAATAGAAAVPTLDVYLGWPAVLTHRWSTETAWWTYRSVGPHGAAVLMTVALVVLAGGGAGYALLARRWHGVAAAVVLLPATGWLVLLPGASGKWTGTELRSAEPMSLDSAAYYLAAVTSAVALVAWLLRQRRALVDAERARRYAACRAAGIPEEPGTTAGPAGPVGSAAPAGPAGPVALAGSGWRRGAAARVVVRRRSYVPVDPRKLLGAVGAAVTGALGAMAAVNLASMAPVLVSGRTGWLPTMVGWIEWMGGVHPGSSTTIAMLAGWALLPLALLVLPGWLSGAATALVVAGTAGVEAVFQLMHEAYYYPDPNVMYLLLGLVALGGARRRRSRTDRWVAAGSFLAVLAGSLATGPLPWGGAAPFGDTLSGWQLVTLVPCALMVVAAPYAMSRWSDETGRWGLARCWRYAAPLLGLAGALAWAASQLALPAREALAAGVVACAVAVVIERAAVRLRTVGPHRVPALLRTGMRLG